MNFIGDLIEDIIGLILYPIGCALFIAFFGSILLGMLGIFFATLYFITWIFGIIF